METVYIDTTAFNRTTVECKVGDRIEINVNVKTFNRTTVECKVLIFITNSVLSSNF